MSNASGKLVIIGILTVALASAGISWWFRYNATRQAAIFWGAEAAAMIRDAPHVTLIAIEPDADSLENSNHDQSHDILNVDDRAFKVTNHWDVSKAHGLTHLRNALLEDRSFVSMRSYRPKDWASGLEFRESPGSSPLVILFTSRFACLLRHWPDHGDDRINQCDAIDDGLETTFHEWSDGQLPAAGLIR